MERKPRKDAVRRPTTAKAECSPPNSSATKWGEWYTSEAAAEQSARDKARNSAKAGCRGGCVSGDCTYTETGTEVIDTEVSEEEDVVEYRVKARSWGTCSCK